MQESSALPQHGAVLRGELLGHDTNALGGTQLLEEPLPERGIHSPGTPGVRALRRPEVYLHAVATDAGLRLDEHVSELHERPPLAQIMLAEEDQDTVA